MKDKLNSIINPSNQMRTAPFWSWNDKLDEDELRRQIREMADKGWGGYFMHSRVGLVTGYLSDEWFDLINACADEADKTGTSAWIYDEDKWPSGFAGGLVPEKNENYRGRAIVLLKHGTATVNDTVLCSFNYNETDYDICKRICPLGDPWFNGATYTDLMNPEAIKEFIDCTHERYKEKCGQHFGRAIPGIFTDEPSYMYQLSYNVPAVPWSEFLPDFFEKQKGYDILTKLPMLFFDIEDYHKVRFDFYDSATELFRNSFTKQYYDWCEQNGLIMTGHFMYEDTCVSQTQWSGDVMSHYEFMQWPGVDKLGRTINELVLMKQLTSATDQLGKEKAFCEAFGGSGQDSSFFLRKWIGDWMAILGINFVNHHLSLYSMRGERKRDWPPNLFYQQPWWDDEKEFADYQARLCAAISEGEREVDVLLIQPLTSVWSEYSPLHQDISFTNERAYDEPFAGISARLMEEKLDFHYGNETLMARHGSTERDQLKIGKHTYKCVIVPPALNLRSSTLDLLTKYAANGGKLIFTGGYPNLIDGADTHIEVPGAIFASSTAAAIAIAAGFASERVNVIDKLSNANARTVYVHSRNVEESTRHLIVNIDSKREVQARVHIPMAQNSKIAVFDLYDGNIYKIESSDSSFDVTLSPGGSVLIIAGEEASLATAPAPAILGSGASFSHLTTNIPEAFIEDFTCEPLEDNVFLLNDFMLELNGEKVYEGPAALALHKHFYPAPEGTPFKATYTCYSESEIENCFAAIEMAENLKAITFNGVAVQPMKAPGESGAMDPSKSWKDVNFTRVPLPIIKEGINTLTIQGIKSNNITNVNCHCRVIDWQDHQPTEAEEIYICGKFNLKHVSPGRFVISEYKKPSGKNLAKESFPFYCGRVNIKANFKLLTNTGDCKILMLNGLAAASARVKVNNQYCGTVRWKPYAVDITTAVKPGDNTIEIEMATTLANTFGPNRFPGRKESWGTGPETFVAAHILEESYTLYDFGVESIGIYTVK